MPGWLGYTLLSIALWGVWGLVSAAVGRDVEPLTVQFISTSGMLAVGIWLLFSRRLREGTNLPKGFMLGFATGVSGNVGNLLMLRALFVQGPPALVIPLSCMYPAVTALMAWLFLKEKLSGVQTFGFVLALVAGVAIGRASAGPSDGTGAPLDAWLFLALAALVLFGLTGFLQKVAAQYVSNELCTLGFLASALPIAAVVYVASPDMSLAQPARVWGLSVLFGLLMGVGTLALFAAYRRGKASVITALVALFPGVTVLLSVPILHETLDTARIVALVLALAAGVALGYEPAAPAASGPSVGGSPAV